MKMPPPELLQTARELDGDAGDAPPARGLVRCEARLSDRCAAMASSLLRKGGLAAEVMGGVRMGECAIGVTHSRVALRNAMTRGLQRGASSRAWCCLSGGGVTSRFLVRVGEGLLSSSRPIGRPLAPRRIFADDSQMASTIFSHPHPSAVAGKRVVGHVRPLAAGVLLGEVSSSSRLKRRFVGES